MKSLKQSRRTTLIALAVAATFATQAQATSSRDRPVGYVAQQRAAAVPQAPSATTLLLQDVAPWGTTSNEDVLSGLGIAFDTAGSADLARVPLSRYRVVIVASDQPQAFYDALKRAMPRINRWVFSGKHTLQFHGADQGWEAGQWSFRLPLNVSGNHADYQDMNDIIRPARPVVAGLPSVITGSAASHTSFNLGRVPSSKVTITTPSGAPTLFSYCYGRGRVFAAGQTLEFAYAAGWDFAQLLVNMTGLSTNKPGC